MKNIFLNNLKYFIYGSSIRHIYVYNIFFLKNLNLMIDLFHTIKYQRKKLHLQWSSDSA